MATLFDAALETGLSGTSRLHDFFVNIEGMTPGEYKNGGKKLSINYSWAESPFGLLIVASTEQGECYRALGESRQQTRARSEYRRIWQEWRGRTGSRVTP